MQCVAMDIVGPLPLTEAFPMPDMETGNTIARQFVVVFSHTDQGRNFESNLVKEMCGFLGLGLLPITLSRTV